MYDPKTFGKGILAVKVYHIDLNLGVSKLLPLFYFLKGNELTRFLQIFTEYSKYREQKRQTFSRSHIE